MMIDVRLYQSSTVLLRMDAEAGNGPWCAVTFMRDGKAVLLSNQPALDWSSDQMLFANDMAKGLNKLLHHDGFWIVGWTHPAPYMLLGMATRTYGRMVMIWCDADGDPQFTIESEDPVWKILECGPQQWAEQAEQAWQKWRLHMREILDPREGQTFKRAQGQAAPNLAQ
jgi:hypothetical protein